MHWSDESTGLVGGFAGVYRSTDGGATWTETLDESCLDMAFQDNLTGICGSYSDRGGVWLTEDGGLTWTHSAYPWVDAPDAVATTAEGFLVGGRGSAILSMRALGLLFSDGFESGNTSAWSAVSP